MGKPTVSCAERRRLCGETLGETKSNEGKMKPGELYQYTGLYDSLRGITMVLKKEKSPYNSKLQAVFFLRNGQVDWVVETWFSMYMERL